MIGVAYVEAEVVLVGEVDAVYPRAVDAVCLGKFALMILQVVAAVYKVHEAYSVILTDEAEVAFVHLLVGGDIKSVVVVAVAVHVVGRHKRVVVAAAPCLIDERVVVAALVVDGGAGNEAVGSDVRRVVQLDIVRTLDGRHVGEGRLCIGAGHSRDFLTHGAGVGCHQADPFSRLRVDHEVGSPAVALGSILQHEGTLAHAVVGRIERTVVGAVEACEASHAGYAPVADGCCVECLVEDALSRDGEGERHRQLVVDGQRGLPHLRQSEVGIDSVDGRLLHAVGGRDGVGIAHADECPTDHLAHHLT